MEVARTASLYGELLTVYECDCGRLYGYSPNSQWGYHTFKASSGVVLNIETAFEEPTAVPQLCAVARQLRDLTTYLPIAAGA
jgi:hypothetical protein